MKLARLEITSLPGLSNSFCLQDLADDINLITGPNAIGKSSLVRALKLLLGEPRNTDPLAVLAAEFIEGDKRWRVDRTGQQIGWKCDGEPATRPNLPGSDQIGRYCLSMEDLISADATDESLAKELQRELCGGFDLDSVRTRVGSRHGANERKALDAAHKSFQEAEREAEALRKSQEALPSLELKIKAAMSAEEQERLIDQAKSLLEEMRASKAARDRLEEFPSGMEKMNGQELEDIEKHRSNLENSESERRNQEHARRLAQSSLENSAIAASDLKNAAIDLEAVERTLRKVEKLQMQRSHQESALAKQSEKFEDASRQLGGDPPLQLDMANIAQAEGFAADYLRLDEKKRQLEQRIELSGGAADERNVKQHENAVQALRNWLDLKLGESPTRRIAPFLWASLVLAMVSAVGFIFLPPAIPALLSLLLLGTLLWALISLRSSSTGAAKARQHAREQFEQLDVPAPEEWNVSAVGEHLSKLENSLKNLTRASEAQAELTILEEKILTKEEEKRTLSGAIGFDPLIPLTSIDRFIRLAKDWDESRLALETAKREHSDTGDAIKAALEKARGVLSRWVPDVPENADFDWLSAAHTSFGDRLGDARQAASDIENANQQLKKLETEIARQRDNIESVYEKVGLCEDDHQLLVERTQQLKSWRAARGELTKAEAREGQCRSNLAGRECLLELVGSGDEAMLDHALEEAKQQASQLESLRDASADIQAKIRHAEAGRTLEDTIAKRVQAQMELEEKRDELLIHESSKLLLGRIEQERRTTNEPRVFREANALIQGVTANAFELQFGDDGSFRARDTQQNAIRELQELSTGTRMQLLLAVRVAWVRSQSADGRMLPLFLDEALTTSDESRFMTVAKSLAQISALSGIQVIYLSARRHEQDLWRAALGRDPHSIDLGTLRGQGNSDEVPRFEVMPLESIPKPMGDDTEYARQLGVPPVIPVLDAGEIHLFHLLRDDLDLLYKFLDSLRISSLGQFESYLQQSNSDHSHLIERCRAARAWVAAWRMGRGRRVGALELERSGAFSSRYLRDASALASSEQVSGNASRLLASLRKGRLKGFQAKKINDFETWLKEHQYLDDRAVLSREERRQRLIQSYGLQDEDRIQDIGQCIDWLEAGVVNLEGKL